MDPQLLELEGGISRPRTKQCLTLPHLLLDDHYGCEDDHDDDDDHDHDQDDHDHFFLNMIMLTLHSTVMRIVILAPSCFSA